MLSSVQISYHHDQTLLTNSGFGAETRKDAMVAWAIFWAIFPLAGPPAGRVRICILFFDFWMFDYGLHVCSCTAEHR